MSLQELLRMKPIHMILAISEGLKKIGAEYNVPVELVSFSIHPPEKDNKQPSISLNIQGIHHISPAIPMPIERWSHTKVAKMVTLPILTFSGS